MIKILKKMVHLVNDAISMTGYVIAGYPWEKKSIHKRQTYHEIINVIKECVQRGCSSGGNDALKIKARK